MLFSGPLQGLPRPHGRPDCKEWRLDHRGHHEFEFVLGGTGLTGSCVDCAGFTFTMWLRVTLNSFPPHPRDDRVKPLSPLWGQIFDVKLIAPAKMGNLKYFPSRHASLKNRVGTEAGEAGKADCRCFCVSTFSWKAGQLLCTQAACAFAPRVTLLFAKRAPPSYPFPSHCLDSLPLTSPPLGVSEPRSPLWEHKRQSLILESELWGSLCALIASQMQTQAGCFPPQPAISPYPQTGGSQERGFGILCQVTCTPLATQYRV